MICFISKLLPVILLSEAEQFLSSMQFTEWVETQPVSWRYLKKLFPEIANCSSQALVCFIIFPGGEAESGWGSIVLVTARTGYFSVNSSKCHPQSRLSWGKIQFITNTASYKHISRFLCQHVRDLQTRFDRMEYNISGISFRVDYLSVFIF